MVNLSIPVTVSNAVNNSLLRMSYNTTCKRASSIALFTPIIPLGTREMVTITLTLKLPKRYDTTAFIDQLQY